MKNIKQIIKLHKSNFPKIIKENQCDSIIEYRLLNHLQKSINNESRLVPQFEFKLINNNKFRADFLLFNSQRKVVIECDGKEFHGGEKANWYDEWRDSLISQLGEVDVIYRFIFNDITNNLNKIIEFLKYNEPTFFKEQIKDKETDPIKIIQSSYNNRKWTNDSESLNLIIHYNPKHLMNRDIINDKMVLYSIIHKDKTVNNLIEKEIFNFEDSIEELIKKLEK